MPLEKGNPEEMDSQRSGGPQTVTVERVERLESRLDQMSRQVDRLEGQLSDVEKQQKQINELRVVIERLFDFLEESGVFREGSEAIQWDHFSNVTFRKPEE